MIWRVQINLSLVDRLGKPPTRVRLDSVSLTLPADHTLVTELLAGRRFANHRVPTSLRRSHQFRDVLYCVRFWLMTYRALLCRSDDQATRHFHISYSAVLFGYVNRILLGFSMKLMLGIATMEELLRKRDVQ